MRQLLAICLLALVLIPGAAIAVPPFRVVGTISGGASGIIAGTIFHAGSRQKVCQEAGPYSDAAVPVARIRLVSVTPTPAGTFDVGFATRWVDADYAQCDMKPVSYTLLAAHPDGRPMYNVQALPLLSIGLTGKDQVTVDDVKKIECLRDQSHTPHETQCFVQLGMSAVIMGYDGARLANARQLNLTITTPSP